MGRSYVVRPGDTLAKIAREQSTTIGAIVSASSLANPDDLSVGQELVIPGPGSIHSTANRSGSGSFNSGYAYYAVEPGDSLYSIATRFGTTEAELRRINELSSGNTIHPDQKIRVPLANYKGPIAEAR